jgi:hypothetical protein
MKVLISKDYGAGWSTWNCKEMAIDKDLIALFERGCTEDEMIELCRIKGYDDGYGGAPYLGGFDTLVVVEVPKGEYFIIREYDGVEYIELMSETNWLYAEE